jgi:hypothetical protein
MVIDTRASDVPVAEEEQVQEYIDAFTDDSIGASGAPRPSGPSPFASDEYNAREQQMREQGLDELPPADPTQIPTESEPVSVPNPSYEDPAPPTVQPQPVPVIIEPETMELPVLNSSEFAVCDDLEVPSSPLAQLMFLNSASANPTVVCLGEAVGDACEATTAEISVTGGVDGSAYVVERNDGQCALGFSSDAETAALCDLTSLLETSTGETRSFSEWSDEFDADPGGMMAMLIEDNVALFTGASSGASCVTYELPR